MKRHPIRNGLIAGLILALPFTWPAARGWLALGTARGNAVELKARLSEKPDPLPSLVEREQSIIAVDQNQAQIALMKRVSGIAQQQSLLIEDVRAVPTQAFGLITVELTLSGSEAAVIAAMNALEADVPVARFETVKVESLSGGGLRLSGRLVAPWQS